MSEKFSFAVAHQKRQTAFEVLTLHQFSPACRERERVTEKQNERKTDSKVMSSVRQVQSQGGEGSFPIRSLEVILHLGERPSEI